MAFDALDAAVKLAGQLQGPLARLKVVSRELADQAGRAAISVALNLSEGRGRAGGDRVQFFRIAQGSAQELRTALMLGRALGIGGLDDAEATLDRVCAMTWRLTH